MQTLHDANNAAVGLGPRLGSGGEGEVFALPGNQLAVAKVLQERRRQGKYEKLRAMVERPPLGAYETVDGFPVLTWPKQLLFSSHKGRPEDTFVGYTMTRIRPVDFVPFYQLTTTGRRQDLGGTPMTWDRLLLLAMRLCHLVRTLHRFGYAVGDLNDRNVLVSRRLTPLLMDTDSFQVPRRRGGYHPSMVGDQLYWPPELLGVDLTTHTGDRQSSDHYALGVLLFQLFMNGLRPYQSRGSAVDKLDSLVERTRAGHYPWVSPKAGVLEPPASAPAYDALPKSIRTAFEKCFVAGHKAPKKRPTPDDWYEILAALQRQGFRKCSAEARHIYGAGEKRCAWCSDAQDRFGAAAPIPKPVAPVVQVAPRRTKAGGQKAGGGKVPPQRPRKAGPPPTTQQAATVAPALAATPVRPKRRAQTPRSPRARQPSRATVQVKVSPAEASRALEPFPRSLTWLAGLTAVIVVAWAFLTPW